jgi:hypothetical protein
MGNSLLDELIDQLSDMPDEALAEIDAEIDASIGDMPWVPTPGLQQDAYFRPNHRHRRMPVRIGQTKI